MTTTFKSGDVLVRLTAGHAINPGDVVVVASLNHNSSWLRTEEHGDWDFFSRAFRRLEEGETLRLSASGRELYGGSFWNTPLAFERVAPTGVFGYPLLYVHTADTAGTRGAFRVNQLVASATPEFPTKPEEPGMFDAEPVYDPWDEVEESPSDFEDEETEWAIRTFDGAVHRVSPPTPTPSTVIRARNFADQFTRGREPGEFFDYLTENGYLTDQAYRDMSESLDEF